VTRAQGSPTMTTYLLTNVYPSDSDLNMSDQITVPADVWTLLDNDQPPIFVAVGDTELVGRLRPAIPSDNLGNDTCIVPTWMWRLLDADPETWVSIRVCELPMAGTIHLRARNESSLTEMEDPVVQLSAALSGECGPSWSCLSTGAELPLTCGVFDVMEIRTSDGEVVPAACILDCDVNMEIVPALDHVRSSCIPAISRPDSPYPAESAILQREEPEPEPEPEPKTTPHKRGFVPFSGVGRRLCE